MELQELAQVGALENLKRDKELVMVVMSELGDSVVVVEVPQSENDFEKEMKVASAAGIARAYGSSKLVLVSDVWMTKAPKDADLRSLPRPSESPDRQEGLVAVISERGESKTSLLTYERVGGEIVVIEDWTEWETVQEGQMPRILNQVSMLPEPSPEMIAALDNVIEALGMNVARVSKG